MLGMELKISKIIDIILRIRELSMELVIRKVEAY